MKKELLLQTDILDIIFENRNKAYGAYNLRKYYDQRMNKAVGIMLGFAVLVSALTFLPEKTIVKTRSYIIDDTRLVEIIKPKEKIPEVKPIVKPPNQPAASTAKFISRIKIVTARDTSDKLIDIDNLVISNNTTNIVTTGGPSIVTPVLNGNGKITEPEIPAIDKITPTYNADVMPSYPGGWDALKKFLERNLNNPREMEAGELANVKIRFVVGYDGKLKSFTTVQDGGEDFNKEVVRVLKKMPDWIPGRSNGENVSVYYTIPVKFVTGE